MKIASCTIICFYVCFEISCTRNNPTTEEQLSMSLIQLINYCGYSAEEYEIETDDDYILTVQRILGPKDGTKPKVETPVIVLHGFASDAGVFVSRGKESLGFMLVNAGFDVWLGNFRGTRNSKHKKYSRTDWQFWNYSYDELAKYDVIAMWNYVLNVTQSKQLFNVALSMGVASSMATLASLPEYNDKIKGYIGMGPVTRLFYAVNEIRIVGALTPILNNLPNFIFSKPIFDTPPQQPTCSSTHCSINDYLLAKYKSSGISVKVGIEFAQGTRSNSFNYFNYGIRNLFIYKSLNPSFYNLSQVTAPVALFTAAKDSLADPLDLVLLQKDLRNLYAYHVVPNLTFSHDMFLNGLQAPELVYSKIIQTLQEWTLST